MLLDLDATVQRRRRSSLRELSESAKIARRQRREITITTLADHGLDPRGNNSNSCSSNNNKDTLRRLLEEQMSDHTWTTTLTEATACLKRPVETPVHWIP